MDLKKSLRCQTDVALSITKHLFSKQEYQDKNLIFSPLSLHVALSVMAAGSAGDTLQELLSFLQFDSIDDLTTFFSHLNSTVFFDAAAAAAATSSHHLSFANGMWVDKSLSISHSFKQLVATHYKATLASLDFWKDGDQERHKVNSWVEKKTNGLITEILPPRKQDELTRLVFANALYFKGEWENKFLDPVYTYDSDFHLLNGTSVKVPIMATDKKMQFVSVFDGLKVLRLSYKQGIDKERQFSMYIFLPDAKDGLPYLIEKMASESSFLKDKFPQQEVRVWKFKIPKFKISFSLEASNVLKELGVVSPFSDANFTKLVDSPSDELYVDSMYHKASIEVNEEGTEAAAASSWRGGAEGMTLPAGIDFEADHPFLFLIREDLTGTIIFIGQVLNPLDGADPPVNKEEIRAKSHARFFQLIGKKRDAKEEEQSSDFGLEVNGEKEDEGADDNDKHDVPRKRKMVQPKKKRSRKDK